MKNTLSHAKFSFLIYQKDDVFVGICKETGYIEEARNFDETLYRLVNGTKAIYLAVKDKPELLQSINRRLSLKYSTLFYFIPFYFVIKNIFSNSRVELFDLTPPELFQQV